MRRDMHDARCAENYHIDLHILFTYVCTYLVECGAAGAAGAATSFFFLRLSFLALLALLREGCFLLSRSSACMCVGVCLV
jgi:hypothetical protein